MTGIGPLNERLLHAALEEWYRREGDQVEAPMEGFVMDLVPISDLGSKRSIGTLSAWSRKRQQSSWWPS